MKQLNYKPGSDPRRLAPDAIETFTTGPVPDEGTGLLAFLMAQMPDRKRTNIKELLRHNQVAVNGHPQTNALLPLAEGDTVQVNFTRPFHTFSHRRMKLVYEDDDIIVINKGYGLLSMATDNARRAATEETAYAILRKYVKWGDTSNKIFIVHRLDRDTSGLMMFARNEEAKNAMQHNWNNMVLERKYVCVVDGQPEADEGTVRSYLKENAAHEIYSVDKPQEGAKLAVTRWKVLARGKGHAMLEVSLDTGRKNQIRVHMKDLGHPITGDRRYGGSRSPIGRLALHAQTLKFAHPVTHKLMDFTAPVPDAFHKLLR